MKTFTYESATDVGHALSLLAADPEAKLLGGGTNLIDLMKQGAERPASLIDITGLPLNDIEILPDGSLRIGAAVRNSDLAVHPVVRSRYPVLSRAVLSGASGQLRNMATTGGNLFQRTRCNYFMDTSKPCNKRDPGSGCPAIDGEHRNLAILGASSHCVATHPSDMAVALSALDAVVRVTGQGGDRAVSMGDFHRLPGDDPTRDTTISRDEIVTAVDVPALTDGSVSVYRKVRDRASYAFAVVSVGAVLTVDGDVISDVRISLGGVAHTPWRASVAESLLVGSAPTAENFAQAIARELEAAEPLRDNEFKIPLAQNLVVNTMVDLTARARKGVEA